METKQDKAKAWWELRRRLERELAHFAAVLMLVGLVVGFAYPGPITGAFLPAGLLLWWIVGSLAQGLT